jgi:hypothetical protein
MQIRSHRERMAEDERTRALVRTKPLPPPRRKRKASASKKRRQQIKKWQKKIINDSDYEF